MRRRVLFVEQNRDGTVGGSHTALLMLVQHLDLSQFEPVVAFYESNALIDAFRRHAQVVLLPAPRPLRIARADAATGVAPVALVALGVRKVANLLMTLCAALWRTLHVLRIRPHLIHVNNHVSPGFEWVVAARLWSVIYDAIDADFVRSQACHTAAAELRRQFGIAPDELLFGVVGNIKAWKGQDVSFGSLNAF